MMKLSSIGLVAGLAALLLSRAALAISETKATAFANGQVWDVGIRFHPGGFRSTSDRDANTGPAGQSIAVLADPELAQEGDVRAFAMGSANAAIGKLGASVSGTALGAAMFRFPNDSGGGSAIASAQATAEWLDTVTLRSPRRTAVKAVFNVFMDGKLDVSTTTNAASSVAFNLINPRDSNFIVPEGPLGGIGWGVASEHPLLGDDFAEIPGAFRVELTLAPGSPTTIGLGISLVGTADSDIRDNISVWKEDAASFSGEVSRTVKWGGVESVFDAATGAKLDLADFTFTSESGFDYSKPFSAQVPEPAASPLAVYGWWLLASRGTARRRRSSFG